MYSINVVKISDFLTSREERYKPDDSNLDGLKRLDKIDFSGNIHLSEKPTKTDMIIVHSGDLVISGINVQKGAIAVYQGKEPITATIHYSSYTFDSNKIDIEYFKRFLKSPEFLKTLGEQVKGGIKTEIKPKTFLPIEIKLPDLSEQQKINKYFNSFEQELSELKSELNKQEKYVSQLKQAILQEAIVGQLTAEWRTQNPMQKGNPDTDAAALLAKIKAEKQQLIADGKLKKEKPLAEIAIDEIPFSLPDTWVWCRFQQITKAITCGIASTPAYYSQGRMFLSAKNIKPYKFMPEEHKFIDEKTYQMIINNAKPEKGDILMTRVGAGIGESAIIDKDIEFAYYVSLTLIKPFQEFLESQFILHFLNSNYGIKNAISYTTGSGSSQGNLNVNSVRLYIIPLPPLAEQKAIVEKVDRLMNIIDRLEQQIKHRKQLAEDLMQTVLREAFE
jgi:type I restriction enzyme S subunit